MIQYERINVSKEKIFLKKKLKNNLFLQYRDE